MKGVGMTRMTLHPVAECTHDGCGWMARGSHLSPPVTVRSRGKHRLTLKQRLMRWNERTAEELRRAQPKHNAGKAARTAMMLIPIGALTATLHNPLTWPVYMATCALWVPAAAIGVNW